MRCLAVGVARASVILSPFAHEVANKNRQAQPHPPTPTPATHLMSRAIKSASTSQKSSCERKLHAQHSSGGTLRCRLSWRAHAVTPSNLDPRYNSNSYLNLSSPSQTPTSLPAPHSGLWNSNGLKLNPPPHAAGFPSLNHHKTRPTLLSKHGLRALPARTCNRGVPQHTVFTFHAISKTPTGPGPVCGRNLKKEKLKAATSTNSKAHEGLCFFFRRFACQGWGVGSAEASAVHTPRQSSCLGFVTISGPGAVKHQDQPQSAAMWALP